MDVATDRSTVDRSTVRAVHVLLVLLVGIAAYVFTYDETVSRFNDDAVYYMLGRALASGEGYVNIWRPDLSAATHFPPGYPAIIAAVMQLSGSFTAVKIANGAFFLALLVVTLYLAASARIDVRLAVMACSFVALNSWMLQFSSSMMSEMPFTFFATLALYAFTRLDSRRRFFADPWWWMLLVAVVAAVYIRTIGIALLGAVGLGFLLRKEWVRAVSTAGVVFLAIAPWLLYSGSHSNVSYLSYIIALDPFDPARGYVGPLDIIARITANLLHYLPDLLNVILPGLSDISKSLGFRIGGGVVILIFSAFGLVKFTAYRALIAFYVIAYLGILLVWNEEWYYHGGALRLLVPLIPIITLAMFTGLWGFLDQRFTRETITLCTLALLFFFTPAPVYIRHVNAKAERQLSGLNDYIWVADWAKRNTPEDSIIACTNPVRFGVFSERFSIPFYPVIDTYAGMVADFPSQVSPDEMLDIMERQEVDYVVLDELIDQRSLDQPGNVSLGVGFYIVRPLILSHPDRFVEIVRRNETVLYRFHR